jgi:hypothetical protein
MMTVILGVAVVGIAMLAVAILTGNTIVAFGVIAIAALGLVLLARDWLGERRRVDATREDHGLAPTKQRMATRCRTTTTLPRCSPTNSNPMFSMKDPANHPTMRALPAVTTAHSNRIAVRSLSRRSSPRLPACGGCFR